jgi:hypothetical protein
MNKRNDAESNVYSEFKEQMLGKGRIYWAKSPLNAKQSFKDGVYIESDSGLVPYDNAYDDAQGVLDSLGVKYTGSKRDSLYNRYMSLFQNPQEG